MPQGDMDVSFRLHNAQLSDIKVYSYTDGVKGDKNLLEGVDIEPNGYGLMYNTKLPVGDYWWKAMTQMVITTAAWWFP
ncbi:MAG: hypothetical protein V8S97_02570 [Oscillospiraceae bacterium]